MTDTREDLGQFLTRVPIQARITEVDRNPHVDPSDWDRGASHWRVTLRYDGRRMQVYFSRGSAHTEPPTVRDVIGCLAWMLGGAKYDRLLWHTEGD